MCLERSTQKAIEYAFYVLAIIEDWSTQKAIECAFCIKNEVIHAIKIVFFIIKNVLRAECYIIGYY